MSLKKGLVGHWTLDAGATSNGTAYDSSAYDNHGTLGGVNDPPLTGQSGIIDESYKFVGESDNVSSPDGDYVEIPSSPEFDTTSFSATAWVYVPSDSNNDGDDIVLQNQYQPGFWLQAEAAYVSDSSNSYFLGISTNPPADTWYHISTTYDGSTHKVYYNAIQENSQSVTTPGSVESSLQIGTWQSKSANHFDGKLDDVRMYNRALSENEISALYNMRSQRQQNAVGLPHTQNLLLHLNARNKRSVDESNNRWYDISGNNYEAHGTSGDGVVDDSSFPNWEAVNGGRFILNGSEGWNVPGPIETSGQVSLESWFYRTDTSDDPEYLSDARNGTGNWHLTNYSGYNVNFGRDLQANDPAGGDYTTSAATSSADSNWWNKWTHLVATSDGSNSQLFIDGQQITDDRLRNSNGFSTGIGQDFAIANRFTGRSHLQGYISVYRVYDDILSSGQVKANYNAEKMYYK